MNIKKVIKYFIKKTFLYNWLKPIHVKIRDQRLLREWVKKGKPVPPPHAVKLMVIRKYAKKFSIKIFIETGTDDGATVASVKNIFNKIYSIELSIVLYARAKDKFSKDSRISIIHGDSSKELPKVLKNISEPCLFWIDAHYSAGISAKGKINTPAWQELQHILKHPTKGHVILIDDARKFTGKNDYPSIQEVQNLVFEYLPDWSFKIKNDIIRIHAQS